MASKPPFVIHVSEMADFPEAVYIGRENGRKRLKGSKWSNPFAIGKNRSRAEAIEDYDWYIHGLWSDEVAAAEDKGWFPPSVAEVSELTGKPLACWCRRSDEERTDANACHGDVLVELWKESQP